MRKAETHETHRKVPMISGQSKGPVLMWICPYASCGNVTYTYVRGDGAPICVGGLEWSFSTVPFPGEASA